MPDFGFVINRLRVAGDAREDAEVEFRRGFNVIAGASNTGKSYILQLINFMMGGKQAPKEIAESKGYSRILLEITDRSGADYVLERGLAGGDFSLFQGPLVELQDDSVRKALKATHNPKNPATVSAFLLSLCKAGKANVLMNAKGRTRPVSFRDLARFALVDEVRIIDERTPVHPTGQLIKRTEDRSVFTFMISGNDATGVTLASDTTVRRAEWGARRSTYEELIAALDSKLSSGPTNLAFRIEAAEQQANAVTTRINELNELHASLLNEQRSLADRLRDVRARLMQLDSTLNRFVLLREHYESDLKRLQFINEADFLVSQLGPGYCPVCGSSLEEHRPDSPLAEHAFQQTVRDGTIAEMSKLQTRLAGLDATTDGMRNERQALVLAEKETTDAISVVSRRLNEEVLPAIASHRTELATATDARIALTRIDADRLRLHELQERLAALGSEPKRVTTAGSATVQANLDSRRQFADKVGELLRAWKVEPHPVVEFDESLDLVVSGKPRRSHGKGHRAIIHAAFTIGLMQYCIEQGHPHPCIAVLDSPLTSYKPKDGYDLDEDIQRAFWEYLVELPHDQQVIILENKEPPPELMSSEIYEHFSGDSAIGRAGFYPPPRTKPRRRASSAKAPGGAQEADATGDVKRTPALA